MQDSWFYINHSSVIGALVNCRTYCKLLIFCKFSFDFVLIIDAPTISQIPILMIHFFFTMEHSKLRGKNVTNRLDNHSFMCFFAFAATSLKLSHLQHNAVVLRHAGLWPLTTTPINANTSLGELSLFPYVTEPKHCFFSLTQGNSAHIFCACLFVLKPFACFIYFLLTMWID